MIKRKLRDLSEQNVYPYILVFSVFNGIMFKYLSLPAFEGDRNLFLGTLMKLALQK